MSSTSSSSPPMGGAAPRWSLFAGAAASLSALAWTRTLQAPFLGAAAMLAAGALLLLLLRRRAGTPHVPAAAWLALVVLLAAAGAGAVTVWRLDRVATGWERVAEGQRERLGDGLEAHLAALLDAGRRAAAEGAAAAASPDGAALFARLARAREETGVEALAIVDGAGELVAWSGDHRGSFPPEVRQNGRTLHFVERPLFSYLYVAHPTGERAGRAVAAILLETDLALAGERRSSLADRFQTATGARPRFRTGASPGAAWRVEEAGEVVVSAHLELPSQADWRRRAATAGQRAVALAVAVAFGLLFLGWRRLGAPAAWGAAPHAGGRAIPAALPLGLLAGALVLLPLGQVAGAGELFSPTAFLLPLPLDVTLGTLLAVLAPVAALAAVAGEPAWVRRHPTLAAAGGAAVVAVAYPLLLDALLGAASPALLQGGVILWWALGVALALALALATAPLLPSRPADPGARHPLWGPLLLAAGVAGLLSVAVLLRGDPRVGALPLAAALWAVPFLLATRGLPPPAAPGSRVLRWLMAGVLAGTAVLPQLWLDHVHARLDAAEREVSTLGDRTDPFLDYLLRRFAAEADTRARRGEEGVELLYRAWVGSGLAEEGYPGWITLWGEDELPRVTLEVGGAPAGGRPTGEQPSHLTGLLRRARATGSAVVEVMPSRQVTQALAVPLPDGAIATVSVPPRRTLEGTGTLLRGVQPGGAALTRLTLVPATGPGGLAADEVRWHQTEQGWRSEALVPYPDGPYHAHLEVHIAPLAVRLARGTLLLGLDLAVLALLWLLGRVAGGEMPAPRAGWRAWVGSFRARVTLALLAFFLAPTFVFGALSYRSLAGEVLRTAALLAERSASQAVAYFEDAEGDLTVLAQLTGTDVLFYHRGELLASSTPEGYDLGLYGAWMPPSAWLALESGEEVTVAEARRLVGQPHVVAYSRMRPAGTLAAPVSLQGGEAALRQRELAHLVLFAALLGALLSVALSLAVGRSLTEPIGQLRRAAGAVGAGRLDAHLPEDRADEFGQLFGSFNRMTRQLRRARGREVRAARVLAWGEMARQVAHEIKNPLTPIKLSVQHLRRAHADRRPDFGAILDTNVEQILGEIDRLSDIARAFSRYGAPAEAAGPLEAVDVAATVRETLTLYRSGEGALRYADAVEPALPPARARVGELKEVLVNLLENARAAVAGQGHVAVSASLEGERIALRVADDGEGIPPELLPRVFEPQFSTRSAGTGLGLAIVRRLVEGWGGDVAVESELGRGTTVTVWLPLAARERPPEDPTTTETGEET